MPELIDRPTARLRGQLTYFTGGTCVHGHVAPHYVSTGACVECARQPPRVYIPYAGIKMSRSEASRPEVRSPQYFTGVPCLQGHISKRGTVTGRCLECERLRMNTYNQKKRAASMGNPTQKDGSAYAGPVVSKAAAKRQGLRRYFSGVVCEFGHLAERYAKNDQCVACANLRQGAKK